MLSECGSGSARNRTRNGAKLHYITGTLKEDTPGPGAGLWVWPVRCGWVVDA